MSVISLFRITVMMLIMGLHASAVQAFVIRSCNDTQTPDVEAATDFIESNITTMVGGMTFLNATQQGELIARAERQRVRCRERHSCRTRSDWGGYAHGGLRNAVKLCYDNLVDTGIATRCTIVGVILHEMGHTLDFPIFADHNGSPPSANTLANDIVYQTGNSATAFCQNANGFTDSALSGTLRAPLGGACNRNTDCTTGTCQRSVCVCDNDLDCGGGNITCVLGGARQNVCLATNLPRGAACRRDRQCQSDQCRTFQRTCR